MPREAKLLNLMFAGVHATAFSAVGLTTSNIDTYFVDSTTEGFYHRTLFSCQLDVIQPTGGTVTRLTPQMNIVKVHDAYFRLQAVEADGSTSFFTGYGDQVQWNGQSGTYHQNIDNDWDAPWVEIQLTRIQDRSYTGFLKTPLNIAESDDISRFDFDCQYVDDLPEYSSTTLLMSAVIQGDFSTVSREIDKADIDVQDDNGYTALMYAVLNNNLQLVNQLLQHGADANVTNVFNNDALNYALAAGNQQVALSLIQAGAKGTAFSKKGDSSLSLAIDNDLFAFMLRNNLVAKNALPTAIAKMNIDQIAAVLTHNINVNAVDYLGNSALHIVAANGDVDKAKLLLDHHAKIDLENRSAATPLALTRSHEMSELLMASGAAVVSSGKSSPLHNALFRGDFALAKKMLATSPDLTAVDNRKNDVILSTVLARANNRDVFVMVKELLVNGANAKFIRADGETALIRGTLARNIPLIKLLIDEGANVDSLNEYGFTALGYARYYNYCEEMLVLGSAGAKWDLGRQPLNPSKCSI